jgi:hypothetical protein
MSAARELRDLFRLRILQMATLGSLTMYNALDWAVF